MTLDEQIAAALRAGEPHAAIAARLRVSTRRISAVAKAQGLTRKRGPTAALIACVDGLRWPLESGL